MILVLTVYVLAWILGGPTMTVYCPECDRPCDSRSAADECARIDAREDAEARRSK